MGSQHLEIVSESRSKPNEQRNRNFLLKRWLGLFAINAGQALDVDTLGVYVTLWTEAFADLDDATLEAAFKRTLATCKFWPIKVADIREHIETANTVGFDLETEAAWRLALKWCARYAHGGSVVGHDENGRRVLERVPSLPTAHVSAIRAAGGARYLESCSTEDLVWAKKAFIAHFKTIHETGQVEHLLKNGEAKRILEQLKSGPRPKQLAAVERPIDSEGGISREEVRTVLNRVAERGQAELPSEEEWEARKARLKKSALEWAAARGLTSAEPNTVNR